MCGICGVVCGDDSVTVEQPLLERMCSVLAHRGPDDHGWFLRRYKNGTNALLVGLGHTRLSIIDLDTGQPPMSNEDGTVWIAFNGEIYNFQSLRPPLESKGHKFRTCSDTEVIVHAYEEWGTECVERFRGLFAFALWVERERRLLLARDRLGQKPLYYWHDGHRFAFGSELKALLQVPGVPRRVDPRALYSYLTYQYVPHPLSMFAGIRKLPPAHSLVWQDGRIEERRYWLPDFALERQRSAEAWCAELRERLKEATRLRLISDVPLGAFLSGGIDSSITVGLMSQIAGPGVKTFSIRFEEKKYDESDYAREVAEHFHTDHREMTVRPNAVDIIPKLVWHYDEPFSDSSAIPTYYVSQMTREHVKVALTGDAGDECFAGYPRYRAVKLGHYFDRLPEPVRWLAAHRLWQKLPASVEQKTVRRRLKRLCQALAMPPRERYLEWIAIFNDDRKLALCSKELLDQVRETPSLWALGRYYDLCASRDAVGQTTFVDLLSYLPDDLMTKVDIASMAHGLETRSPFLDHEVVEFAATMPTSLKLRGLTSKYVLKQAFKDLLPAHILRRRKMGFGVPVAEWFRGELKDYVRDVLLCERSLGRGYFRRDAVQRLVAEHTTRQFDHGYRLWSLLMFELWHRRFIDEWRSP